MHSLFSIGFNRAVRASMMWDSVRFSPFRSPLIYPPSTQRRDLRILPYLRSAGGLDLLLRLHVYTYMVILQRRDESLFVYCIRRGMTDIYRGIYNFASSDILPY
ncbi:uncharacterized protein BDCG_17556 [Blastomyces dermatitidis ER-3]|uniref:Uncharacterized protein n=2 Tax=Ajellomyces dermatitidis TaxID=5039 RepID=A0A0J9ERH8_AJEDA|nr:uncharacterized protein BDCG_17556 [Blastomyces dermatitidis ER-3]KMW68642.1 hypothetical protein BDDG_12944 [Blastomyces dermatitidis ATCC 18188]OAT02442.1 hypothetical protein BDCG_17556 [Blastomyces dermatitidis ER-3]